MPRFRRVVDRGVILPALPPSEKNRLRVDSRKKRLFVQLCAKCINSVPTSATPRRLMVDEGTWSRGISSNARRKGRRQCTADGFPSFSIREKASYRAARFILLCSWNPIPPKIKEETRISQVTKFRERSIRENHRSRSLRTAADCLSIDTLSSSNQDPISTISEGVISSLLFFVRVLRCLIILSSDDS